MHLAWDESYTDSETLSILKGLALAHTREGGVVGHQIGLLITEERWSDVVAFEIDYSIDWDVLQLIHCRQALGFFTKLEFLDIGVDKEHVAHEKFKATERACATTNNFFRTYRSGSAYKFCILPDGAQLLEAMRRKIRKVLGKAPDLRSLKFAFGPGATTSIKRMDASPCTKMAAGFACSTDTFASGYLPSVIGELPHWADALPSDWFIDEEGYLVQLSTVVLHDGKLVFVPKNAKTYRTVLIEPTLNGLVQKGIGSWMERRLSRFGIDIRDQTRNATLARQGSLAGDLATLDLSSASDLISLELVRLLLPEDWWQLLSAFRTGTYTYKNGEATRLEKFSGMGNGYTFPLETLIFWAVVRCSSDGLDSEIGVYGDDIICPVKDVDVLVRNLSFCGFSVNSAKSYWSGHFRESCGKDYYKGFDIRPLYAKRRIDGEFLFTLHNFYVRNHFDDEWKYRVRDLIPTPQRLYGPDGYGDGHLIGEYDKPLPPHLWEKGYRGKRFDTYTRSGIRKLTRFPGDWVSPLYSVYIKDRGSIIPGSDSVTESAPVQMSPAGLPYWPRPGSKGYKRVSIYILG